MLAWEGEGDGGLWWGLWCGCCSCCCCCCWYLLFRWSMKASRFRSMSALCRLVRASRLWAAVTVCRCSDVCTRPTLEKRRALFPSVRYSRGYSKSSVEIMWLPPRSGSEVGGQKEEGGVWKNEAWGVGVSGKHRRKKSESPPTSASRNISGWRRTHSRHTKVETYEAGGSRVRGEKQHRRGQEREKKREMGWDVSLFATRTEQFLAELLISSSEGKKNEKSKVLLQQWIKEKHSNWICFAGYSCFSLSGFHYSIRNRQKQNKKRLL